MIKKDTYFPFRDLLFRALKSTDNDEDLKKEVHKLLSQEVEKQSAYLVRPLKKVNKTIH